MLPTVHYNMGGIPTNYHGEVLTKKGAGDPDAVVPGLMAVGEAACVSVHGANRLGSNSLIDLVVFGRAAGLRCAELIDAGRITGRSFPPMPASSRSRGSTASAMPRAARRPRSCATSMQRMMQANCAVFRTGEVLEEGHKLHPRCLERRRRHQRHRPLADLELRPRRDAGARQPHRPGGRHHGLGASTARKAAARMRARISRIATTSNWMKHTLAWIDRRSAR